MWTNPGGDFEEAASASADIGSNQWYTWWSTEQLVADVQGWVDDPSTNFGWLVKGQESLDGAAYTARSFISRHTVTVNQRPNLIVTFTPNPDPDLAFTQFVAGDGNSTRAILRNNDAVASTGRLSFVDENGDPAMVSIDGTPTDSVEFVIEPWGSFDISTDSTGELSEGVIQVFVESGSASNLEGTEIFFLLDRYVSVPGARLERKWQVYVSRTAGENTGIAVQNPDLLHSATLELTLLDSGGTLVANDSLTLLPGQGLSEFVGEDPLFRDYFEQNPEDFQGTLNIQVVEGEDVAVLGLIQKIPSGDLIAVEATNNPFVSAPQP